MFTLLQHTAAGLTGLHRQWRELLSSNTAASDGPTGRLVEITDLGPTPGNLRMLVHVPQDLPPRAPLVVVLHGCTQTAAAYDQGAGWSTLADEQGFAVLYPEQRRSNHPHGCFDWYQPHDSERDRGEAMSIRLMIERMLVEHNLDRNQVCVTGLSAGGAMASVMLATYPELFAGGAILAGLPYRSASGVMGALDSMKGGSSRSGPDWAKLVRAASAHAGPWPRISIWQGDADTTVAPSNAQEIVKQWTELHGIDPASALEERVDGAARRVWLDHLGREVIEAYLVPGLKHGVPIQPSEAERLAGAASPFMLDAGISSTRHIAKFWGLSRPSRKPASSPLPAQVAEIAASIGSTVRSIAGLRATESAVE